MSMNNENNPSMAAIHIGSVAATVSMPALSLAKKAKIKSLSLVDGAGVAANNTNYVTVQLKKGATLIAEYDTRAANEGALAALVGKAMPIEAGQEVQDAASDLSLVITIGGTGALVNAKLMAEYFPL